MTLHFAPLQGYTDDVFLASHREVYGGGYKCYTPFIRLEKGAPRPQDIKRFERASSEGLDIVPQVIFRSVEEFCVLTESLKSKGVDRIDLNLGCPYPMQTRKGRGAAMISDVDTMAKVAETIKADTDVSYSIKMRLGLESTDEWKCLMPILNDLPLAYITMHPRIASQLYGGELYYDSFAEFMTQCVHPVIYNGDLCTREDIVNITARCPSVAGVMIGRGMLACPSLMAEWMESRDFTLDERMAKLCDFHDKVFTRYEATLCGQTQILQKIKPFWDFLEPVIGHKAHKAIKKAVTLDKYRKAVEPIFMLS